jgi:hypothetical protein
MLENFSATVSEAIKRTRHIHARVGFEQGPQVGDPRAPEWRYALNKFLEWWDQIVKVNRQSDRKIFTITTEFGPFPYMPSLPFTREPLAGQFEINCYMKELLTERYGLTGHQ